VSFTQWVTRARAAQGGVTLGPEQGELEADFSHHYLLHGEYVLRYECHVFKACGNPTSSRSLIHPDLEPLELPIFKPHLVLSTTCQQALAFVLTPVPLPTGRPCGPTHD
jgi:hypothetical protein